MRCGPGDVFAKTPAPGAVTDCENDRLLFIVSWKRSENSLPYPQLLTYTKHPESSLPFYFPGFRSWQVSKLRNKCDWLWTARAASRLQVYGREGFPGFYWTIGEWLPLCWMGLKGWAVHSYFYNMNFNQTKWVVGWRKFFVKLYWKINMQT